MSLQFRNLNVTPDDPVERWGVEGLAAAIDRGEVQHWARIVRALEADSTGAFAHELAQAVDIAESPGVRALFTRALERAKDPDAWDVTQAVGIAFRRSGLTQAEFAERAATSRTRLNSYLTGAQLPSARVLNRIERVGAELACGGGR